MRCWVTSWPFTTALSQTEFEQSSWRKQAIALGQVDISKLQALEADILLELAEQEQVESRLISIGNGEFQLDLGPFEKGDLGPAQMLMVQNLESLLPSVSTWLSDQFSFLPRWRIEDLMATYGNEGANCGAHFDQYSVFLVQLKGSKHWSLDHGNHTDDDLNPDSEVRVLDRFVAEQTLEQVPGEVLYIPPGVGHHGIASDDCITLSVGIRNPLPTEMASHLVDRLLQQDNSDKPLNDGLFGNQIKTGTVDSLSRELLDSLLETDLVNEWYGCFMTELRDPELLPEPDQATEDWLQRCEFLSLNLPTRIAVQEGRLFVNGECIPIATTPGWLLDLQQHRQVNYQAIPAADHWIVEQLLQHNALCTERPS